MYKYIHFMYRLCYHIISTLELWALHWTSEQLLIKQDFRLGWAVLWIDIFNVQGTSDICVHRSLLIQKYISPASKGSGINLSYYNNNVFLKCIALKFGFLKQSLCCPEWPGILCVVEAGLSSLHSSCLSLSSNGIAGGSHHTWLKVFYFKAS